MACNVSFDGSAPFIRLTMIPRMFPSRLGAVPAHENAERVVTPHIVGVLRPWGSPSLTTVTPTYVLLSVWPLLGWQVAHAHLPSPDSFTSLNRALPWATSSGEAGAVAAAWAS